MCCTVALLIISWFYCFAVQTAEAAPVSLDFRGTNGSFDFDSETGTFDDPSGVSLLFEALVDGSLESGSDLNATASNFGINQASTGDDTDELDTVNGVESVRITFTAPPNFNIFFQSVEIGSFGSGDSGTLIVAGGTPIGLSSGTVFDPLGTEINGAALEVIAGASSSFGFNGLAFLVEETSNPIPEPNTMALLAWGTLLLLRRRRRLSTPVTRGPAAR